MNNIHKLFTENWAIEQNSYTQLISIILPALKAGNIDTIAKHISDNKITAYCTTPYLASKWELDDSSLPFNSIAVIKIEGILYSWETFRLQEFLLRASNNSKIAGVVLWINGPGGMISNLDVVSGIISNYSKPISAFVAGTAASAHFWLATSAHRTFIASKMCDVGSVGILTDYFSYKKMYELNGIDIRTIYAPSSDLKNIEWREIEDNNNEDLVKANLEYFNSIFCDTISKNLNIPFDKQLPLFRGQLFTGNVALEKGYIDEIGTLEDAAKWVLATATANEANNIFK